MDKMDKEIEEIIKKNLPAHVGDTLKKRLDDTDRLEKQTKEQDALLSKATSEIHKYQLIIEEYKAKEAKYNELGKREADVAAKERQIEIESLKNQLASAAGNAKFAQDVAMGLVRNTEYRKTAFGSMPIKQDSPGGYSTVASGGTSNTETNQAQ
jgi:septal ring factor EnvC (AmiA/AmiB activator)